MGWVGVVRGSAEAISKAPQWLGRTAVPRGSEKVFQLQGPFRPELGGALCELSAEGRELLAERCPELDLSGLREAPFVVGELAVLEDFEHTWNSEFAAWYRTGAFKAQRVPLVCKGLAPRRYDSDFSSDGDFTRPEPLLAAAVPGVITGNNNASYFGGVAVSGTGTSEVGQPTEYDFGARGLRLPMLTPESGQNFQTVLSEEGRDWFRAAGLLPDVNAQMDFETAQWLSGCYYVTHELGDSGVAEVSLPELMTEASDWPADRKTVDFSGYFNRGEFWLANCAYRPRGGEPKEGFSSKWPYKTRCARFEMAGAQAVLQARVEALESSAQQRVLMPDHPLKADWDVAAPLSVKMTPDAPEVSREVVCRHVETGEMRNFSLVARLYPPRVDLLLGPVMEVSIVDQVCERRMTFDDAQLHQWRVTGEMTLHDLDALGLPAYSLRDTVRNREERTPVPPTLHSMSYQVLRDEFPALFGLEYGVLGKERGGLKPATYADLVVLRLSRRAAMEKTAASSALASVQDGPGQ